MDILTPEQRSYAMSRVKGSDTSIELKFRRYLWAHGMRGYRIKTSLPGKPDIYFPKHKVAVFIDGCFWHNCPICRKAPKGKNNFWKNKLRANVTRDKKINALLQKQGIVVLRFWEHEIHENIEKCFLRLKMFVS